MPVAVSARGPLSRGRAAASDGICGLRGWAGAVSEDRKPGPLPLPACRQAPCPGRTALGGQRRDGHGHPQGKAAAVSRAGASQGRGSCSHVTGAHGTEALVPASRATRCSRPSWLRRSSRSPRAWPCVQLPRAPSELGAFALSWGLDSTLIACCSVRTPGSGRPARHRPPGPLRPFLPVLDRALAARRPRPGASVPSQSGPRRPCTRGRSPSCPC